MSLIDIIDAKKGAANNKIKPIKLEHKIDITKAVLNKDFSFPSSLLNSAVYFITPVLIAPFAKVIEMVMKLVKIPIKATPDGPVKVAITLPATKPDAIFTNVTIPENRVVLINFIYIISRTL